MPHLELERLGDVDARAVDVAGSVAAAQLLARELVHALVVQLHLLDRLDVVVHDHLSGADDRHRAQLARREPGKMRVRDRARWEADHEEDHILDLRLHEARAGGLDPRRLLVEPVQRDRDVVRTEVPQDVDVELVEPEVDALAVDVLDAPDAALGEDLLHRDDSGVVHEGVADHERAAGLLGRAQDRLGIGDVRGEWFLDEDVLAGGEGFLGERAVRADRRRDAHGVDRAVGEERAMVGGRLQRGEPFADRLEPLGREVRDRHGLGAGRLAQVADEVRAPVARAEDGDAQVALGHSSFRMTAHPSPSRSFVKPAFSYMLSGPW